MQLLHLLHRPQLLPQILSLSMSFGRMSKDDSKKSSTPSKEGYRSNGITSSINSKWRSSNWSVNTRNNDDNRRNSNG